MGDDKFVTTVFDHGDHFEICQDAGPYSRDHSVRLTKLEAKKVAMKFLGLPDDTVEDWRNRELVFKNA